MTSNAQRVAIKLSKAGERSVRAGHPWIFEKAITKLNKDGNVGDIAVIYGTKSNKVIGIGLYDPHSPIRIKMLHHNGVSNIDKSWIAGKIAIAYDRRVPLLQMDTNSYRLIFGENDGMPSLIVDVYAEVAVIKLYSLIWKYHMQDILEAILHHTGVKTVVLRLSRNVQKLQKDYKEGQIIHGVLEDPIVVFREHGILFSAHVIKGHKTGYFLDHRDNRRRIGELSEGKSVLDIFAYAGGFSVHALAGRAKRVISLDISKQALEMAKQNVALNDLSANHNVMAIDAFEGMQKLQDKGQKFDIVIVDPPSFAKSAADVIGAINSYRRLTKLAIPLVSKGGLLLSASCSSRVDKDTFYNLLVEELDKEDRFYKIVDRTYHDVDHPISFPEGSYLKSVYIQLD
jgi:23S rRNA (cytosine1962-C5)-methyltransferase